MKSLLAVVMILFGSYAHSEAVSENSMQKQIEDAQDARNSAYSWDFNINSFSNNYGLGAGINSPQFWNSSIHFNFSGAYAWAQGVPKDESSQTWAPYGLFRLGVYGGGYVLGTAIRGYGGGGPLILLPSNHLSDRSTVTGGFGLVGLEFPLGRKSVSRAMYLEFGGMGTGAKADKLKDDPIYANGFLASWGFRYLL